MKDGVVGSADEDYARHYAIRERQPVDRPQYDPLEGADD